MGTVSEMPPNSEPLVVTTGPVPEAVHRLLAGAARLVVTDGDHDTLLALAAETEGFIVRGDGHLPASLIEAAPRLRVIARSGIGVDNVDVAAATRRGIPVVVTPDVGAVAVAEGAIALLLALAKRLAELDALVRSGRWAERETTVVSELAGSTLGVVGMGRIGRRAAGLGAGFGMHVVAADPALGDGRLRELGVEPVTLAELFDRSDHITLHAPLLAETRGMVTAELLGRAGPGAFLVNLARGGLIESLDAVADALDAGALAGVGLDVFDAEPPDLGHRIFSDPRVLLSPHALGLSDKSRRRIFGDMSQGVRAVLEGRRPEAVANPEVYGSEADGPPPALARH